MKRTPMPATGPVAMGAPAANNVVVIDVGGTRIRCGGTQSGTVIGEVQQFSSNVLRTGDPIETLVKIVREFAVDHELDNFDLVLGIPATLDRDLNAILRINNIPALLGLKLRSILEERLSARVILEHDIVLQLIGEWVAGSARGIRSVLGVYSGTGLGGGFLVNGESIRTNTTGVELGHVPVRCDGRRCICGLTDCVEVYACGHHLVDWSEQFGVPVEELFLKEMPMFAEQLDQFLRDQAAAIAIAVTLLDPEVVVIGGGVIALPGFPLEKMIALIRARLQSPEPANSAKFVRTALGELAAVYGGMHLASKPREPAALANP